MDKLGTYALVAALKGLTESSKQQRRRESDRWISLQASTLPQLDMTLDAQEGAEPVTTCAAEQQNTHCECCDNGCVDAAAEQQVELQSYRTAIRTSYIRQINEQHDRALRRPRR